MEKLISKKSSTSFIKFQLTAKAAKQIKGGNNTANSTTEFIGIEEVANG